MVKNVGSPDRLVRILLALGIAALGFFGLVTGTAAIVCYVIAAVLALTAIIGTCPIYSIAGVDTCVKETSYSDTDDRAGF